MPIRFAITLVTLLCATALPATFHIDPNKGSSDGDGSEARPWKTLAQSVDSGKFKQVKDGDTVLLYDGYHGAVSLQGDYDALVTIAAAKGQRPTLSRFTIGSGSNWLVRGLTISPSLGDAPYKGNIVSIGESRKSSDITLEDCFVYTVLEAKDWDAQQWMSANSGILLGRHGRGLVVRNCYVLNTRFGIALTAFDAVCEGNVVSDFSADGIRATRDGQIVRHNLIKNVYVSASDGDENHDDGIQCFLFNKGTGTVKGVHTIGNIIIAQEDPARNLAAGLQGIGYFDGPLVDFVVEDNVVNVNHWHGIALFDAQNARVERNVVWTSYEGKPRAWIMFGTKQKLAKDNLAKHNHSCTYKLEQPGTIAADNLPSSEKIYAEALDRAYKTICDKFGASHFAANRPRMGRGTESGVR